MYHCRNEAEVKFANFFFPILQPVLPVHPHTHTRLHCCPSTCPEAMEEPKTSVSPQIPPVSSHHEHLLHEVESSDGQLGAILRYASRELGTWLFVTSTFMLRHGMHNML